MIKGNDLPHFHFHSEDYTDKDQERQHMIITSFENYISCKVYGMFYELNIHWIRAIFDDKINTSLMSSRNDEAA